VFTEPGLVFAGLDHFKFMVALGGMLPFGTKNNFSLVVAYDHPLWWPIRNQLLSDLLKDSLYDRQTLRDTYKALESKRRYFRQLEYQNDKTASGLK
jgi:hypothetical protein